MKRNKFLRHVIEVLGLGALLGAGAAGCNGPAENRAPVFTVGQCDFTAGTPVEVQYNSFLALTVGDYSETQSGLWTGTIGGGMWLVRVDAGQGLAGYIDEYPGELMSGAILPQGGLAKDPFEPDFFALCPETGVIAPGETWTRLTPAARDVGEDAHDHTREFYVADIDDEGVAEIHFIDRLQQVKADGVDVSDAPAIQQAVGVAHLDVSGDTPVVLDLHADFVNPEHVTGIFNVYAVAFPDADADEPKPPIHDQPERL